MAVTRGRSHGPRRGAAVEREASQGREQSGALRTNPDSMDQLLISERAHPLWPSLGAGGGGTTVGREASQRREWGHGHTFPYPKAPEMFFFASHEEAGTIGSIARPRTHGRLKRFHEEAGTIGSTVRPRTHGRLKRFCTTDQTVDEKKATWMSWPSN
jgi:hypothetical protein